MNRKHLENLRQEVEVVVAPFRYVTRRKMFGCDAFFAQSEVFALVWKDGEIGVKLLDETKHRELASLAGVKPWTAGKKTMRNWLLVPDSLSADRAALSRWVVEAYREAKQRAKARSSLESS